MDFREAIDSIRRNAKIIFNPSEEGLREMAADEGRKTRYGSTCYYTRVRGRSAGLTEVLEDGTTPEHKELLSRVVEFSRGKQFIQLDRQMGVTRPFFCRAYVTPGYAHIPLMWGKMLFPIADIRKPDFETVQIPEWPETKVLVEPGEGITFVLGSDYTGELKKANLRLAMYRTKQAGGLGLHAGSKMLRVQGRDGKLKETGVLLFGLSATGKTTLTCHHHWLDALKREGVAIRQDDVVLMQGDSYCAGTEKNFYIKTDGLEPENQPVLYEAAVSGNALFENVVVGEGGTVDFFDTSLTTNGRAVVLRREIRHTDLGIDIERADIVLFITRRDTIVPPVARLTPEQGAAFFMLGESVGSSASDIAPGKSRRVVGTNPFIIGPEDEEGNRFYDLLKKNPHVECYLLNTGRVGRKDDGAGEKITVRDSATIIKEIAKHAVEWKTDPDWGYGILDSCPGAEASKFHPEKHYGPEEYRKLTEELRGERKAWLSGFSRLYPEIKNAI
ncbi:phosphoenolpyruvate carboxykinase [Candidatus Micrarchaeota archaeon]|nr:phosphoenolpyruvate carboxykinase [Candidatus Micrarchaeota archaeon]